MKRDISLPQNLEARVAQYLREHPNKTFADIVEEALEKNLEPQLTTGYHDLLAKSGFVKGLKHSSYEPERPEDSISQRWLDIQLP